MEDGVYKYSIEMLVPLGVRRGEIELRLNKNNASGTLNILGSSNRFTDGRVADGRLKFCGIIKTLLYDLPFNADGAVNGEKISLKLATDKGVFDTKGVLKYFGVK